MSQQWGRAFFGAWLRAAHFFILPKIKIRWYLRWKAKLESINMKILIWFGCMLVTSVIAALITGGTGALGFIPAFILYAPMFYIA